MATAEEREFQKEFDEEKWLKSEKAGRDLCGEEEFCAFCDKDKDCPCGRAHGIYERNSDIGETDEDYAEFEEESDGKEPAFGDDGAVRYVTRNRRSFLSKLIQNESLQQKYSDIKNAICCYKKVKSRIIFRGENIFFGRKKLAFIAIRGKSLYLYLALDCNNFLGSKYRFEDVSEKKTYEKTPMKVKVSGVRSFKHAVELLNILAKNNELSINTKYNDEIYSAPYENDAELTEKGLIKKYLVAIKVETPTESN